jgi:hypothetical protein
MYRKKQVEQKEKQYRIQLKIKIMLFCLDTLILYKL